MIDTILGHILYILSMTVQQKWNFLMKKILQKLSDAFGYKIPECQSLDLYFQLMALQVGTLANPEAKDQLAAIEKVKLLCEICELLLENKIKVINNFIAAMTRSS